jgi:hypothetical protein
MNSKSKKERKKKHPNNNHNNKKQRKQNKKNPFSFYLKCKQVSAGWFKKSEKNFYLHIWEEEDKATEYRHKGTSRQRQRKRFTWTPIWCFDHSQRFLSKLKDWERRPWIVEFFFPNSLNYLALTFLTSVFFLGWETCSTSHNTYALLSYSQYQLSRSRLGHLKLFLLLPHEIIFKNFLEFHWFRDEFLWCLKRMMIRTTDRNVDSGQRRFTQSRNNYTTSENHYHLA